MKSKAKTNILFIYALILLFIALFIQVTFGPELRLREFGWWLNGFSLGLLTLLVNQKKKNEKT